MNKEQEKLETIKRELAQVINRHSLENVCDTPDFVLAEVMLDALMGFGVATRKRDRWYGMAPKPGGHLSIVQPEKTP